MKTSENPVAMEENSHVSPDARYYWLCQLGGWTAIWLLKAVGPLLSPWMEPHPTYASYWAVYFLTMLCFSHGYRCLIHRLHWKSLNWWKLLPRVLAVSTIVSLLTTGIVLVCIWGDLSKTVLFGYLPILVIKATSIGISLMMVWSVIYFGYHHQRAFQEIQLHQLRLHAALKEAEHRALSAQVNPHFLFNSLNTLRSLIEENPARARTAVTELALVFRASLQTTRKNLIPLREELQTVNAYLSLERARHEERLRVHEDIAANTLDAMVPPFLLQTLVENAVKFGIASRPEGGEISYSASFNERGLVLRVTNPGDIRTPAVPSGVGIENSRLRLRLLFGPEAFLNLSSPENDLVLAEVFIPRGGSTL